MKMRLKIEECARKSLAWDSYSQTPVEEGTGGNSRGVYNLFSEGGRGGDRSG